VVSGGDALGILGGGLARLTSTFGSATTCRTQATISSGSSPRSMRQSISASASGGITFRFSLPRSMFTAKVVRSIAAWCRSARKARRNAGSASERVRSS
jgi:hypothetical protein